MNRITRLKPSSNINNEFGLSEVEILKIDLVPASLRELNIEVKIFSFNSVNDLDKLKKKLLKIDLVDL